MGILSGMTGFGSSTGEESWGGWSWELKSVNGRGLDMRVNLPPGFDGLDRPLRKRVGDTFKRGNFQISMKIDASKSDCGISVNEDVLGGLVERHEKISGYAISGDALATLMTIRGVVETSSNSLRDIAADEAAQVALMKGFEEALAKIKASREAEGSAVKTVFDGLLDQMANYLGSAKTQAAEQPRLIKERLANRLGELLSEQATDTERLMMEAALVAAKADVQEELDRLEAHIQAGRDHLVSGSPIGRKLDFLSQELNREVNTLCSKSASLELTQTGLELKSLVEQFKEQAANVE